MKTNSDIFIREDSTIRETVGEGIYRQILGYDENLMIVKVKFEKDAVGSEHAHYHSQSTYVVSGEFEFHVGGKKQIVKAGDGIYIAPDINHGVICLKAGILIDAFSPARKDFL